MSNTTPPASESEPETPRCHNAQPQLKGHIQGNLKVGNGRETLMAAITQLLPFVGYPRTLNAMCCLNEVAPDNKQEG